MFGPKPHTCSNAILGKNSCSSLARTTVNPSGFLYFEAKVEKLNQATNARREQASISIGSVIGAVQINSPNATQHVSVSQVTAIQNDIIALKQLLQQLPLTEFQKEEEARTLDRISELAKRDKSPEILAYVSQKLDALAKIAVSLKSVASAAIPLIHNIGRCFGIGC